MKDIKRNKKNKKKVLEKKLSNTFMAVEVK